MDYTVSWGETFSSPRQDLTVIDETRSWFPAGQSPIMNQWQMGFPRPNTSAQNTNAVYACRKVLSEEVSRMRAYHYRLADDGGKIRLRSRLNRILRYPNEWQSRVDFWLNMVDALLTDGNAYALAGRDDTGGINSLTPLRQCWPHVDPETGMVFYGVGVDLSTPLPDGVDPDPRWLIPARNVFHLRLFTPISPLVGEPPLVAARIAADTGTAISNSAFSFFNRAARPSGYLRHPKRLSPEVRDRLQDQWESNYSGNAMGGTAVLEESLDWVPLTMTAVDAELVNQYKLTVEDVARAYRVPLFMLGDMTKATFTNVEQMTRSFYSGGLGFYLELIEAQLARFFDLGMDEIVEFDVEAGLLRSEFKDRIDGLVRGVQGTVFTPDEARRREGLPSVPGGDQPLAQAQMVPLSYAVNQRVEDPTPESTPSPPADEPEVTPDESRALVRRMLRVA